MATDKKPVVARGTSPSPASPSAETSLQVQVAPTTAPVVVKQDGGAAVWMPPERAQGVRSFGELRAGTVYVVAPQEAHRLVTAKGFRFASVAAQAAVSDWVDHIADAPATTAAVAAQQE